MLDFFVKVIVSMFSAKFKTLLVATSISTTILTLSVPVYAQADKKTERLENRKNIAESRIASREARIEDKIEKRKENIEDRIASREALLKERQEKIAKFEKQLKINMATREAALKLKIKKFKDEKRAELAQKLSNNLNELNKKKITEFTRHIEQLSNILTKIEAKTNEASSTAISTAKSAIQSAQDAIDIQSGKDYTITITSEEKVGVDVKAKRDQLNVDLKSVQQKILDARKAIVEVHTIIKSSLGENK